MRSKPQRVADRYLNQGLGHLSRHDELDAICRQYGEARRQMFVECMPEPEEGEPPVEIEMDVEGLFPSTRFATSVHEARPRYIDSVVANRTIRVWRRATEHGP
jgi:hypothetical protein